MYINKTECQWRLPPANFAPGQTVYYYFRKWELEGVFEDIMDTTHALTRKIAGWEESPGMGIIDSRSVKTSHHADPSCKGVDGDKKIKGRKEHIVVDTLGLLMSVSAHDANIHDSEGAPEDWVASNFGWVVEVVPRPDECPSKFEVLPKRWIVERSFSWLENFRRLTIDYEYLADTAVAMLQLAFIKIMLNKFF